MIILLLAVTGSQEMEHSYLLKLNFILNPAGMTRDH